MSNAAIYMNPEGFDTSKTQLMGRHSAGEGFLRGFIRHGNVDRFHMWNVGPESRDELNAFIQRLQPTDKPVEWIGRSERGKLQVPGVVSLPSPKIAEEAWARRSIGEHLYGVCGVTHTTATKRVSDALAEMLTAPVEPWDALICTSRAVRASVEVQLEAVADHLKERVGATKIPSVRLETIPLGIDAGAFEPDPEQRRSWREQLDIPPDALVALYVGRFNPLAKMNPVPMAIALERAVQQTGQPIYWVVSGWAPTEKAEAYYHEVSRSACPSVHYRVVDGRRSEARFSVWSVADFFLSLSDNIQETFGLTPVEAMAAGLPSVISDWDGYRETIRHGLDGFRVATYTPRSGLGADLAFRHSVNWDSYDGYVGATSQFTAVDLEEAVRAIVDLVKSPQLRRKMGAQAKEQARRKFDWSAIIPQYQALWADMASLRPKARPQRARNLADNPWRLDPYRLFASYPTEWMTHRTVLAVTPGVTPSSAADWLSQPIVQQVVSILPRRPEVEQIFRAIEARRQITVGELLTDFPQPRRPHIERSLLFFAKYGLLIVHAGGVVMRN